MQDISLDKYKPVGKFHKAASDGRPDMLQHMLYSSKNNVNMTDKKRR